MKRTEEDAWKRRKIEQILAQAKIVNDLAGGREIVIANADARITRQDLWKALKKAEDKPPRQEHKCSSGRRFD